MLTIETCHASIAGSCTFHLDLKCNNAADR